MQLKQNLIVVGPHSVQITIFGLIENVRIQKGKHGCFLANSEAPKRGT